METVKMTPSNYSVMANALMDILFENNKLGEFDILIAGYFAPKYGVKAIHLRANVVFKENKKFRMPVIVIEKNGKYQDFYYNSFEQIWKQLSESEDTMQSWWEEEELSIPIAKVPKFLEGVHAVEVRNILKDFGDDVEYVEYE